MNVREMNPRQFRNRICYTIATIGIIGAFSLPLSLILEFGFSNFINLWLRAYPQLTYYPMAIFWAPCLSMIIMWRFVPLNKFVIKIVKVAFFIVFIVSIIIVYFEQAGDRMMVFEFNNGTQEKYCMRDILKMALDGEESIDISRCARVGHLAGDNFDNVIVNKDKKGKYSGNIYFDELFRYKTWIKSSHTLSRSRIFYVVTDFCIIIITISGFFCLLTLIITKNYYNKKLTSIVNSSQYINFRKVLLGTSLSCLLISTFSLCLWIPIRIYYNSAIKQKLFVNSGMVFGDISGTEIVIFVFVFSFLFFLVVELINVSNQILSLVFPSAIAFLGYAYSQNSELIAHIFGFGNPPQLLLIVLWPLLLLVFIVYTGLRYKLRDKLVR